MFRKKQNTPQRKKTKGFSELNKRTYEANRPRDYQTQNEINNGLNTSFQPRSLELSPNRNDNHNNSKNNNYSEFKSSNNQRLNYQTADNSSNYSRESSYTKYHEKAKKNNKRKKIKIVVIVIACILAVIIAGGIAFASMINKNLHEGMDNLELVSTDYTKEPFYMVLMGVDSSKERNNEDGTSGSSSYRSDSMMLARIDCPQKKVSLISLHRDTKVDMGEYGVNKLNAAHALGGPQLVVKTVSQLAGVPISHYAEIDFDGFKDVVDQLGGVVVNVPMTINDPYTGVINAGEQNLNGLDALTLCRSRHAYDNYGDGDKYRAANQRLVLTAIAKKILSSDIVTIANTITTLSKNIKTDFQLNDIIGVAQYMKDLDFNKDVYTAMEPTTSQYIDGVWYEILDEKKWKQMMERMEKGLPPSLETVVDPQTGVVLSYAGETQNESGSTDFSSVKVVVKNGTTKAGLAAEASAKLTEKGFKTDAGNANSSDYKNTVIVYENDNQKAAAEAIKDALGCGTVQKNNNEYIFTGDVLVVLGSDYK